MGSLYTLDQPCIEQGNHRVHEIHSGFTDRRKTCFEGRFVSHFDGIYGGVPHANLSM